MTADASELRYFAADLRRAGDRAPELARTAVTKSAADITRDSKVFAPVDTGNLRNSISADVNATATYAEAAIGPTANYGHYVELGTSRQKPQPYMGPAFDRNIPAFQRALLQAAAGSIT